MLKVVQSVIPPRRKRGRQHHDLIIIKLSDGFVRDLYHTLL